MTNTPAITEQEIREALVAKAKAYASKAEIGISTISLSAVNDSKFIARVEKGENFNIKTYQRVMDWLDEKLAETAA